MSFDLYTRNKIISLLANLVREGEKPFKILDIGGREGHIKSFFPKDKVFILDMKWPISYEENYIVGDVLLPPFKEGSFDIVIASELLEHICPKYRLKAISQMLRLSSDFLIITAPFFSKENAFAEQLANEFFKRYTGKPHPFLKEHIEYGLPLAEEVENFLKEKGLKFKLFFSNNVFLWLMMQLFVFYGYAYQIPQEKMETIYRFYADNYKELADDISPCYRRIYLISKSKNISGCTLERSKLSPIKYFQLIQHIFSEIAELTSKKERHITNIESLIKQKEIEISQKEIHIANLERTLEEEKARLKQKEIHIANLERTLEEARSTLGWMILERIRATRDAFLPVNTKRRYLYDLFVKLIKSILREGLRSTIKKVRRKKGFSDDYKRWILKNEPDENELQKYAEEAENFKYKPKISIVSATYNTSEKMLNQMIESVISQKYRNWELCIADGGSNRGYIKRILKKYADKEKRIKVKFLDINKGIAGNFNEALSLATGEFIGFLDHDDELAPFALYEVVKLLNEKPHLDFIYSDEDKISIDGKTRFEPHFKPDWSPDTFLSYNYICHLAIIRKKIIDKIGGFREEFEGSQDYDLFLRVIELTDKIAHIAKILYHWRMVPGSAASHAMAKPYAIPNAKRAISEFLKKRGIEAKVEDGLFPTSYRIRYKILKDFKVSIIIPTRDKVEILSKCISSILEKTTYPHYEIIIVDNQSKEESTFRYFKKIKKDPRIRIISFNHPFNFSAINNFAAKEAEGEVLLFLNNDIEVINSDWLASMLEHCQRKEVGAVGAKLYYPNNTIQHGGVILGIGGVAGHSHKYFPRDSDGYMGRLKIVQNLSAVTGACMMIRKEVFEEVFGFDKGFKVAFGDVDLCMKIRQKGYLIVFTPYAELYHHESLTRGYEDTPEKQKRFAHEIALFKEKWGHILEKGDPYYSPNLTLNKEDFSINI